MSKREIRKLDGKNTVGNANKPSAMKKQSYAYQKDE